MIFINRQKDKSENKKYNYWNDSLSDLQYFHS